MARNREIFGFKGIGAQIPDAGVLLGCPAHGGRKRGAHGKHSLSLHNVDEPRMA